VDNQFNKDASQGGSYREGTGTATQMKQEIQNTASQVKDKVTDFGKKTAEKIDTQREPAAGALEKTASALHEKGDRVAAATSGAAHKTADKIQATADYIREHDVKAMMNDVEGLVRRHPGQALAAAVAAGFLFGRVFRRSA